MKLRLSRRAQNDLQGIAAHLLARDAQAAQHVQTQFAAALHLIAAHPEAGRSIGRKLRRFAVPRLPYIIFYRVDEAAGIVAVATIRHTSRRPIV